MKKNKTLQISVFLLVASIALFPIQGALAQAGEEAHTPKKESTDILLPLDSTQTKTGDNVTLDETSKQAVTIKPEAEDDEFFTTGMMIGIGAGAAVLVGGAIALGGGGGGGGDDAPVVPPTADNLVSAWHAEGNQPGSGRTYSGTYHLYQGGSLGYDLHVSSGEHFVGGGSWKLTDYQLQIHTDHGSSYTGSFVPGNITTINLNSNSQWNLTLTR